MDFGLAKQVQSDRDLTRTGALVTGDAELHATGAGCWQERHWQRLRMSFFRSGSLRNPDGMLAVSVSSVVDTIMQVLERDPVHTRLANRTRSRYDLLKMPCWIQPPLLILRWS